VDLEKYKRLFLEEATEHLAELSRELLTLEKDPERGESIDTAFRMAHSIKGMAASIGYDGIAEVAHRLEDRMDAYRTEGRIDESGLAALFHGLEGLESMVGLVREQGTSPDVDPQLLADLSVPEPTAAHGELEEQHEPKKLPGRR
jgi:two-component system chemotaxis sensor kinase CheA